DRIGHQRRAALEVDLKADALLVDLQKGKTRRHQHDGERDPAEQPNQEPHRLRRDGLDALRPHAPNLVRRKAFANTSGIRCWAGMMPTVPAAQARSLKLVTGSA